MKRPERVTVYPLAWPPGWQRTVPDKREQSKFDATVPRALAFLEDEVRRLGAKNLVISSNYTLGPTPEDPGVCAYFDYQELKAAIPCDRWLRVEDNLHAIAKAITHYLTGILSPCHNPNNGQRQPGDRHGRLRFAMAGNHV